MISDASPVCVIAFSPIALDARVLRQVEFLSRKYNVLLIGYGPFENPWPEKVEFAPLPALVGPSFLGQLRTLLLLIIGKFLTKRAYEWWYWGKKASRAALASLGSRHMAIIHANDWYALPVATRSSAGNNTRLIADLHEYAPLEFENRWYWRYLYKPMVDYFLKKYIPPTSATITVNEMIAERYQQEFGFQPKVVMNTPSLAVAPSLRLTESETFRVVHHGYALPDRKLDLMIETVAHTDSRFVLHLMLLDNGTGYLERLKKIAQAVAPGRVFFDAPVSPSEIVRTISRFDMGFFLLPHTNFSYKAALPNKFFDFIMAGLAVCVGPSPEMARLVNKFGFGVVADSFEPREVASLLNSLTAEQIDFMKARSISARQVLNAEREMDKLLDIYESVISAQ